MNDMNNCIDEMIKEMCPDGVKYEKVSYICDIIKGVQFNKKDMNKTGTYPVINGGVLPSGYIEKYNQYENSITISQGGASAGFVNWQKNKFWAGAHCYVLKPKKYINNKFLYYLMKKYEAKLQECQYGAGIPALAKAVIDNLLVPVPPLPIQEKIVGILDCFTELEAKLEAELEAELEARKKQYNCYRNELLKFDSNYIAPDIKEMIELLCPDGVIRKKIDDICDVFTGGEVPNDCIKGGAQSNELKYPVYSNGIGDNAIYGYSGNYTIEKSAVTFSSIGTIGFPEVRKGKFTPIIRLKALIPKYESELNLRYLKYILETVNIVTNKSSLPNVNSKMIKDIVIPIPPIEIQEKIVEILDQFYELTNELKSGLPGEIALRKKQYEYYRNLLLTFDVLNCESESENVADAEQGTRNKEQGTRNKEQGTRKILTPWLSHAVKFMKLNEVCHFKYGKGNNIPKEKGQYPVYGCNGIVSNTNKFNCEKSAIIGHIGTAGIINWAESKCFVTYNGTICDANKEIILPKYLYHNLLFLRLDKLVKGSQPFLSFTDYEQIPIPVPSLEEQQKIVDILDTFDMYCNDLTGVLPLEIKKVRQQYEYYRNRLLTFEKK